MSFLDADSRSGYGMQRSYYHLESRDFSYKGKAPVDESSSEYTAQPLHSTEANNASRAGGIGDTQAFRRYRDGLSHENTKSVCETSVSSALWKFCLLHLPAMAVTGSILQLYMNEIHWKPLHPTPEEVVALLFAAKIHEILILMSLTDVLLHRIRYGLLRHHGMPLGFISSPFRLSSPLSYLFSWEFWGTVGKPSMDRRFHSLTVGVILVLSLLSFGASPLSGTAMMPRKYWFEYDNGKDPMSVQQYITGNPYETELDYRHSTRAFTGDCLVGTQCQEQFLGPLYSAMFASLKTLRAGWDQTNISVTSRGSPSRYRPLSLSASASNYLSYDVSVATGPPNFVAEIVGHISSMMGSASSYRFRSGEVELSIKAYPIGPSVTWGENWKQPVVAVDCQQGRAADDPTFHFNSSLYDKVDVRLDYEAITSRLSARDGEARATFGTPLFLDLSEQVPHPISAAILYTNKTSTSKAPKLDFELCLVHARWVESEIWASSRPPTAYFSLPMPQDKLLEYMRQAPATGDFLRLKKSWLVGIGYSAGQMAAYKNPGWNPAYGAIFNFCQLKHADDQTPLSRCLPIGLSLYLADALTSLTPYKTLFPIGASNMTVEEAQSRLTSNDTIIATKTLLHIYAYRLNSGLAVRLSFGALCLYLCIAVLHNLVVLFSPSRWTSSAWGSLGELMTLALRSDPPSSLENVGGGVTSSGTWRKTIQVRDVSRDGRLEMVVSSSQSGHVAVPGDVTEGDEMHGLSSDVKPNVEYS